MRIAGLVLLAGLSACSLVKFQPPPPSNTVIAVVGFDETLKDRFAKDAPDGEERIQLSLIFQSDASACTPDGYNTDPFPDVLVFRQSAVLDLPVGRVRVMNATTSGTQQLARIPAGDYAFRDASVSWHDPIAFSSGEWHSIMAPSQKESISFVSTGEPAFLGLYRIGMTAEREVVLEETPAPSEVVEEARRQLDGAAPDKPPLRPRQLNRCSTMTGVRRAN